MPTKKEREYYAMGFRDGQRKFSDSEREWRHELYPEVFRNDVSQTRRRSTTRPKRKLSAWQKFVKANSKKPRFRYKSGRKKGMINLRALGVAYRKKRR